MDRKFLDECDGDPVRAANAKRAFYTRLAFESAKARRKAREYTEIATAAESIAELGAGDAT